MTSLNVILNRHPLVSRQVVSRHMRFGQIHSRRLLALLLVIVSLCLWTAPVAAQEAGDDGVPTGGETTEEEQAGDDDEGPTPLDGLAGAGAEEDPYQKLFEDIADNMKRIEDLLNKGETGGSCQDTQNQTLQRIDELITLVESNQQSSSSPGGKGSPSGQASKPEPQSRNQKQSGQQQEQSERQLQRDADEQLAQQEQPEGGEPKDPGQVPNTQTSEGQLPPAQVGDLPPREGYGRWGQLPKRLIEEMYDNGNRKLPEKYRLVLEEYWRRLPKSTSQ